VYADTGSNRGGRTVSTYKAPLPIDTRARQGLPPSSNRKRTIDAFILASTLAVWAVIVNYLIESFKL